MGMTAPPVFGGISGSKGSVCILRAVLLPGHGNIQDTDTPGQVLAGALIGTTLGYLGTRHLYVSPTEIHMTVPIGGAPDFGSQVTVKARKSLIVFANNR